MLAPGAAAPEFELPRLEGGAARRTDLTAAGPVLLVFFKVSCPTCQLTFPFLDRMNRARAAGSPRLIAISQDDAEATREFHAEFGVSIPTLLDPEEDAYPASNAYGVSHVPSMFLAGADARISWVSEGFSRADLEDLGRRLGVEAFRPGERVPDWKPG